MKQRLLNSLQIGILVNLGRAKRLDLTRLVEASMPRCYMTAEQRGSRDEEIRLQIELLKLYGLIQIVDQPNMRICIATRTILEWMPRHLQRSDTEGKKYRSFILLPFLATSILAPASTGCSSLPGMAQNQPAPVARYNAAGTVPPERMEQFYNPRTGSMVYRFCVGAECPEPTPKIPIARMPVTTETGPDGRAMPPEPLTSPPIAQTNPNTAVPAVKGTTRAAGNDPVAATIAARLNAQRAALQKAAGVEPTPTAPHATPKLSVKTTAAPSPAPVVIPSRPATAVPDSLSQPVLPAQEKPMRTPSAPQAMAPSPAAKLKLETDFGSHRVYVEFAAGLMRLGPSGRAAVDEMVAPARQATHIMLRSRTATSKPSEEMHKLAIGRGVAVREALAARGIERTKCSILALPGGLGGIEPGLPSRRVDVEMLMPGGLTVRRGG